MPRRHHLSSEQRRRLLGVIGGILEAEYPRVAAAYVHGSFVSDGDFADIDLALLARAAVPGALDFELPLETRLRRAVGYPVDVRLLNSAPPPFCAAVFRGGRVLLDRDPDLRAEFESRLLRRHFDFKRFRLRYLKEVVHAPL